MKTHERMVGREAENCKIKKKIGEEEVRVRGKKLNSQRFVKFYPKLFCKTYHSFKMAASFMLFPSTFLLLSLSFIHVTVNCGNRVTW